MLVSNLQLKLNVVNLCNASRRRMHNASCTRRIHGSSFCKIHTMWLYDIFPFNWLYGWKLRGLIMCISRFDKCEPIVQIIMLAISLDMHSGHSLSHSLSRVTSTRCLLMSPLCSGKREFFGERMIFTKFKGSKRFYRQATSK